MNRKSICLLVTFFIMVTALKTLGQGTAFNYQGRLNDNSAPANGVYDLRFALYDAVSAGNAISQPQTNLAMSVTGGVFIVTLNFGPVFTGTNYWLQIGVRTNGVIGNTNAFAMLSPRQPLLPVPYAIFANSASNVLGTLSATQLVGTLQSAQLVGPFPGAVNFNNPANTFSGNGQNLTALNGTQITSGTVADARLSANVALLNANQTFTGVNSFVNVSNAFTGSFFGNGLVGWIPVSGVSTQAVRDAGYLMLSSYLSTVSLPATNSLLTGDIVRVSGGGTGGWRALFNPGEKGIGNFSSFKNYFWPAASILAPGYWTGLACSSDGTVMWAAGNVNSGNNGVFNSTDSGQTWNQIYTLSGIFQSIACSSDGTKIFAAPASGQIRQSTDGGQTWTAISGANATWQAIACSGDGTKLIAAPTSGPLYSLIGGVMTAVTGSTSWEAAAASSDGLHFAAAYGTSVIYSWTGGGVNTWTNGGTASGNITGLAASADGLKLVASINGSSINTSTNFGISWKASGSPSKVWTCIAGSSDCTRLIAGLNSGQLYGSSDFGNSWSAFTTSTNTIWSAVTLSDDATKAAAGAYNAAGTIYYSTATSRTVDATTNSISGGQGTAVELQYIGGGVFMPIGGTGAFWAN